MVLQGKCNTQQGKLPTANVRAFSGIANGAVYRRTLIRLDGSLARISALRYLSTVAPMLGLCKEIYRPVSAYLR